MDDMTAFDRQIAGEVLLGAGPSEPVDDLAIYEAVTAASRPPRWGFTMFSALKLVAAAAIVVVALTAGVVATSLALDEAVVQGRVEKGKLVVLVAFGAGLTWGGTLLRW